MSIKIPDMPELWFDDGTHTYTLHGQVIPSVTQLMSPLSDAVYGGINDGVLSLAAEKGTEVHQAAENYINFGIEDISRERRPYFDGFRHWFDEVKPEVVSTEVKVYHKYLAYGGTLDLTAYINGKLYVVDYKTTSRLESMLTRVQLEAYRLALDSHGINVDGKAILHLRNNGTAKFIEYPYNDQEAWDVFGALLTVNNFINRNRR